MKTAAILLLLLFLFTTAISQKRIALVIGNADYDGNAKLKNPIRDAALIASSLKACQFDVILKNNLSRKNLVKAVDSFSRKIRESPSCTALFYYSGHGMQHSGENYIIPLRSQIDANVDPDMEIKNECIQINEVLNTMQRAGSQINIVILDACRDDPMSRSWTRGSGEKGLAVISSVSDNTFIIFSTSPGRVADDGVGKNSIFTETLAKHILDPGIYIEDVFKRTKNDIVKMNKNQIPWSTSSLGENFSFNGQKPVNAPVTAAGNKNDRVTADVVITSFENYNIIFNDDTVGAISKSNPSVNLSLGTGEYHFKAASRQFPDRIIEDSLLITADDIQKGAAKFLKLEGGSPAMAVDNHLTEMLNKIKYNMVQVHGGEFRMGDKMGYNDAMPEHTVKLNSFSISKTEVTQEQWMAVMGGDNPSSFTVDCKYCPVENVSWYDANHFIQLLDSITRENYSLPTEAEWEFAAIGGDAKSRSYFSGGNKLSAMAWYRDNSNNATHQVGLKATNANGIYDMSGNVSEWCSDWYDDGYYNKLPPSSMAPKGPKEGVYKVVRGGGWDCNEMFCKITTRFKYPPATKKSSIGFRLVKETKD